MQIASDAFEPNGRIPHEHAREGDDESPPLRWSELPPQTKTLSLLVEDPDAPCGGFTHWVVWNIPANLEALEAGVDPENGIDGHAHQGVNDFRERGYAGPRPPTGERHRYVFHLFALDAPLELDEGAHREQLEQAMRGHVLAEATLVGLFGR